MRKNWKHTTRESDLQSATNNILKTCGVPYVRVDYRCRCCGAINNANMAGVPDNIIPAVGIELKTPSGRVSPAQKKLHADWKSAGIPVVVARSVQDVINDLRGLGYLQGVRV